MWTVKETHSLFEITSINGFDADGHVFIFAQTWVYARSLFLRQLAAEAIHGDVHPDYVRGRRIDDEGQIVVAGRIFLCQNEKGDVEAFTNTGDVSGEGARRGESFRKWEPVAPERRREDPGVPGGVQADGQAVDSAQAGGTDKAPDRRLEVRKDPTTPARNRGSKVRGDRLGVVARDSRKGGNRR